MIFHITSKSNDKIKHLLSLRKKKNHLNEDVFIFEGKKALEMAYKNNLLIEVYTLKTLNLSKNISQYIITKEILEKISINQSPEGIVFLAKIPHIIPQKKDKLLYLDNIQDPGNIGTLIRSALALNFDAVIYSPHCCDPYNDKALAASKGSIFSLPIYQDNLEHLKEDHLIIVSTLSDDSISVEDIEVSHPFVLVIGNEAHGVSEETLLLADLKVKIPINNIDSLNAAIAGGILMYELNKKY